MRGTIQDYVKIHMNEEVVEKKELSLEPLKEKKKCAVCNVKKEQKIKMKG